ncbi:helix-turn-helix domain-containing protein [Desulfovibrio inopinatus]|uniref:helix-turn-helix domain-containing protein n=1 Tax=Desulfovibrio inopinatus TaxID=102109 RepID=UPI0004298D60|nr:helix-turn-helix transcriptional regulator [Desulfovibrio inopinatus]
MLTHKATGDPLVLDLRATSQPNAFRAWLAFHGLSLTELAVKVGVSQATLSRLIDGQRTNRDTMDKLVELGVPKEILPTPKNPPGRPKKSP